MVATGPASSGLFTSSNPEDRRVVPDDPNGRATFKVVYVVLESQYQASLTAACKRINAGQVRARAAAHACCTRAARFRLISPARAPEGARHRSPHAR